MSYSFDILTKDDLVLSQFTRLTDGQTDGQLHVSIARARSNSQMRAKNEYLIYGTHFYSMSSCT